ETECAAWVHPAPFNSADVLRTEAEWEQYRSRSARRREAGENCHRGDQNLASLKRDQSRKARGGANSQAQRRCPRRGPSLGRRVASPPNTKNEKRGEEEQR